MRSTGLSLEEMKAMKQCGANGRCRKRKKQIMDGARFDDLLRVLSHGRSRRATLGALLRGFFATGSAALLSDDAEAKKKHKHRKKKKTCKGKTKKCGKKCIPSTNCCANGECGTGEACISGICTCAIGFISCDSACIPADACCTSIDCDGGQTCLSNGSCAIACSSDAPCPAGCLCTFDNTEGGFSCVEVLGSCDDGPQDCASTTECPVGQKCQSTDCGPGGSFVNRCVPLCNG